MENDQVFATESSIQQAALKENSASKGSLTTGHDAATAAGGIGEQPLSYEDTPLLAREGSTRSGGSDGDGRGEPSQSHWTGAEDYKGLPWWNTPSVYWLLPALLLNTLAYGAIIVPKLNLILQLVCDNYFADQAVKNPGFTFIPSPLDANHDQICRRDSNVQDRVAKFTLAMAIIPGLLSSITSPKLGALSDRYGRIKILIITSVGVILGEIMVILAGRFPETVSIYWILVGSIFDGLCGSFTTMMALSNSYASDTTSPTRRGVVFGWVHGCLFSGIAIGPLIAARAIKAANNVLVIFYAAIAAHVFLLIYMALIVPESVTTKRQLAARRRKVAPSEFAYRNEAVKAGNWFALAPKVVSVLHKLGFIGLFTPLTILWPTGSKTSPALRRNLVVLASVDTIQFGVALGAMTVVVLYTGHVFDWNSVDQSYFVAIVNICRVFVLFLILPTITRIVRGKHDSNRPVKNTGSDWLDILLIWTAIAFDIAAFVGYSVARAPAAFVAAACLSSLGGMGSPTTQSSLTKHVPADRVGQLLGAMGMLHGIARVVSPTVFNLIYAKTNGTFPQAVFVALSATFGLSLCISFFIRPHGESASIFVALPYTNCWKCTSQMAIRKRGLMSTAMMMLLYSAFKLFFGSLWYGID